MSRGEVWQRVRGARFWLVNAGAWAGIAALYAARSLGTGEFTDSHAALIVWFECCFVWALLTPVIFLFAQACGRVRRPAPRVLAHAGFAALCCAVAIVIDTATTRAAGHPPLASFWRDTLADARNTLPWNVLNYVAVLLVWHMLDRLGRLHRAELREVELEASLNRAELDALRLQIHPHFLFNTLNIVDVLIGEDVAAARRVLADLCQILRAVLSPADGQTWPLADELRLLRAYLAIEGARFGERLRVDMAVAESARACAVPCLVLQPIVENAIRHGVGARAGGGRVEIDARVAGDRLLLAVTDDGPGMGGAHGPRGIGLANTHARLARLYAQSARLTLVSSAAGTCVRLELPVCAAVPA